MRQRAVVSPPAPPPATGRISHLVAALQAEEELLKELQLSLERQREGVAANDQELIESTIHAIGRTILTLDEARKRRQNIVALLTGADHVPLAELEPKLGRPLPADLAVARDRVRQLAHSVTQHLTINHHVLNKALQAGDAFLQRLFSSGSDPATAYGPAAATDPPSDPEGVLLNKTV